MIYSRKSMAHYGLILVLFSVIISITVSTRVGRTRLSSLKRRNAQEDYDESNTIISSNSMGRPRGGLLAGMPRVDNRNRMDSTMDNSWGRPKPRCNRKIRIQNGVTRFRDKGSLVRYECSFGFSLFGAKLAVCLRDQWSEPPPICAKLGCSRLQQPANGIARVTFGGAVVAFFCNDGYRMQGRPLLYCDGSRWNGTVPSCAYISPPTNPTTSTPSMDITTAGESELSFSSGVPSTSSSTENAEAWDYNPATTTQGHEVTSDPTIRGYNTSIATTSASISFPIIDYTVTQPHGPTSTKRKIQDLTTTQQSVFIPSHPTTTHVPPTEPESKSELPTRPQSLPTVAATTPQITTILTTNLTTTTSIVRFVTSQPTIMTSAIPPVILKLTSPTIFTTTIRPITTTVRRYPKKLPKTTRKPQTKTKRPWKVQTLRTTKTTKKPLVVQSTTDSMGDNFPFPDKTFDKFDEEIAKSSNEYDSDIPESIAPHKLDTDSSHDNHHRLAQMSIVAGIILIVFGSLFLMGGVVMYCWRKNIGIARARSYDTDGRTLSASDANDDFNMWMEPRDSRL